MGIHAPSSITTRQPPAAAAKQPRPTDEDCRLEPKRPKRSDGRSPRAEFLNETLLELLYGGGVSCEMRIWSLVCDNPRTFHPEHLNVDMLSWHKALKLIRVKPNPAQPPSCSIRFSTGPLYDISTEDLWRQAMKELQSLLQLKTLSDISPVQIGETRHFTVEMPTQPPNSDAMDLDKPDGWDEVCTFMVNASSAGAQLPVLRRRIADEVLARSFISLRTWARDGQLEPAATMEDDIVRAAVLALCWATSDACLGEGHMDDDGPDPAEVERRFGLQCVCREGSFTAILCHGLIRGPTVLFVRDETDIAELAGQLFAEPCDPSVRPILPFTFSNHHLLPVSTLPTASPVSHFNARFNPHGFLDAEPESDLTLADLGRFVKTTPRFAARDPHPERAILFVRLTGLNRDAFDMAFSDTINVRLREGGDVRVRVTRNIQAMYVGCLNDLPDQDGQLMNDIIVKTSHWGRRTLYVKS